MRVLVIEDDVKLSQVIREGLEKAGFEIDVENFGESGEEAAYVEDYDAILLDLNLPDKDGIDVLKFLRQENIQTPIIVVTARDDVKARALGLDYGADDYVIKPFDFIELVARIHAVIRRSQGRSNPQIQCGELIVEPQNKMAKVENERLDLSVKEYEILEYLATRSGTIVSNEALVLHVYGEDFDPQSSVLRVHLVNLRKKLVSHGISKDFIETVKGRGYIIHACVKEK